ncbi:MAG: VOC family protein [Deltaproteobacteria bacterium]|nr:VOC family protein [Deltaproteobacteria bacterium]
MSGENTHQTVVDVKDKRIVQLGVVVRDAVKSAKQFAKMFGGGPWVFFDSIPTDATLHGEPVPDGKSCVRLGFGNIGGLEIELLQPLYGPSTHMEFLLTHGEGIHHFSFGEAADHDAFVSALKHHGFEVEMDGISSGAMPFTYMATQEELGTIIEVLKPVSDEIKSTMQPWGIYEPSEGSGLINLERKRIVQIGIVVEDAEKVARTYWDLLGIGPWMFFDFKPPMATCDRFHGLPTMGGSDFHIKVAMADLDDMQIELLQPVYGPSTHMDFLKQHGQGVHHISFDAIDDHDKLVSTLRAQGIEIEMSGIIGGANRYTYLAAQKEIGTILECVKVDPEVESTVAPYGTFPPDV